MAPILFAEGENMGGSSQSTSVKIPAWLEDAGKALIAKANDASKIGYTPYYGPDVAAMTPAQTAAMQGTNQAALAFGVPMADFNAGMPQAQDYNGMSAYSSGGMFDDALAALKAARPGQYDAIMGQFINPFIGGQQTPIAYPPGTGAGPNTPRGGYGPRGGEGGPGPAASMGGSGAYSGVRDMFNGGGPGASGPDFSGGPLSGMLNGLGVNPVGQGGGGGMGGGK